MSGALQRIVRTLFRRQAPAPTPDVELRDALTEDFEQMEAEVSRRCCDHAETVEVSRLRRSAIILDAPAVTPLS